MTIIQKTKKSVESQSHRTENWMGPDWIEVPPELEELAFSCGGYCDLVIEGGKLTDIIPLPKPPPEPVPDQLPTEPEQLRADVDFLAAMAGVAL